MWGKEWGQSQRGRHPHLSCSLPALGSRARASLCSLWTRLAIETGQGTRCTSKGRLETRIRHFTESKPRAGPCSVEGAWLWGCSSEQEKARSVLSPNEPKHKEWKVRADWCLFSWLLVGLGGGGLHECSGRFPTTHIQRGQRRLALRKTRGLLLRQ